MIRVDGKVFASLELAMPFFNSALKIEISNCKEEFWINAPAATALWVLNNAALTSLDAPAATYLRVENNAALTRK